MGVPFIRAAKRENFVVERLDPLPTQIPFRIAPVDLPVTYERLERPAAIEAVYVICADWRSGGTYRVSLGEQSVDVSIAAEPFVSKPCEIDVWEDCIGDVETMTLRGSCRINFNAYRLGIEMCGAAVNSWVSGLVYFTIVDGEVWRPSPNLCADMPLGLSWVGPGRELLYAAFPTGREVSGAYSILPSGTHSVTMIAWLPGVWQVSAKREVILGS